MAEEERRHLASKLDATIAELLSKKQELLGTYSTSFDYGAPSTPNQGATVDRSRRVSSQSGNSSLLPSGTLSPYSENSTHTPDSASFGTWDLVKNVPPCKTNKKAVPIGAFWEHMRAYGCARAAMTFDWSKDWDQQCPNLRARFKMRLHELYPGLWDDEPVMSYIGKNFKERRGRFRSKLANSCQKDLIVLPIGCSRDAFELLYESQFDPKKMSKAHKCRVAAERRFKEGALGHRYGRRGVTGLVERFVSY